MPWPEEALYLLIFGGISILVSNNNAYWRSCCLFFEYPLKYLYLFFFCPWRNYVALSGPSPVHLGLNVFLGVSKPCWNTIYDCPKRNSMRFPEGCYPKMPSECVSHHFTFVIISSAMTSTERPFWSISTSAASE